MFSENELAVRFIKVTAKLIVKACLSKKSSKGKVNFSAVSKCWGIKVMKIVTNYGKEKSVTKMYASVSYNKYII